MRMSHSEYRPILMSAHQVLQSYALLRTTRFDACGYTLMVTAWCTRMVLRLVPKCAIVTVLIAYFVITSVVMYDDPEISLVPRPHPPGEEGSGYNTTSHPTQ